ncbi:putative reverse transcriptase domain-containing protein [Tanacetum coccineum]|uniref:Reverse transcriptase domain-containing protein n=1 Tax=Tanacetum coccineum TaxID=301880 RepID=A0ABQ5AXQ0_9ASTR
MVDISDDVDLVDYDGDDEENPKEDPKEEPEPNNGLVNQFAPHVDPHQSPIYDVCGYKLRGGCMSSSVEQDVLYGDGSHWGYPKPTSDDEGGFDIIIGMDWLSRYDATILCGEKKVRIPCSSVYSKIDFTVWISPLLFPRGRQSKHSILELVMDIMSFSAPILSLPEGSEDSVVYCDASLKGFGAVLMQREKVIVYSFRQLRKNEED